MSPVRVFVSYAHADDKHRQHLAKHLSLLRREQLIDEWHDRRISPGANWADEIDERLEMSDIVLLLISADFLHSDYCVNRELKRALERHHDGVATVVPILLRPCDWQRSEFARLQALPANGFPVNSRHWHNQDEAFTAIAVALRALAEQLRVAQPPSRRPQVATGPELTAETSTGPAVDERFADNVGSLYRLFGYRVTPLPGVDNGLSCEFRPRGAPHVTLTVLCCHAGTDDFTPRAVRRLLGDIDKNQSAHVVFVFPNVPSDVLRRTSQEHGYRALGYDELFDELLNLTSVYDSFCESYERRDIYSSYVPLTARVCLSDAEPAPEDVHRLFSRWLKAPEQLLVLLGDFGSGKSTALQRIKYDLASDYRNNSAEAVPVLIPLQNFDAYGPLEAFIEARFQAELDIRLPVSRLIPLIQQRQFVLLLDGFDEISLLSDKTQRKRAFAKLVPLLLLARKTVITCRPTYFVDDEEMSDVLQSLRAFNASLVKRRSSLARPVFDDFITSSINWVKDAPLIGAGYAHSVVELCPFSATDVERYVRSVPQAGAVTADQIISRIRYTYDLSDLSLRPVLLDLIVKTLPRLPTNVEASPSVIYETYVEAWLNRDYAKGDVRKLMPAAQKMAFMVDLAWRMYTTGDGYISKSQLEPNVQAFFSPAAGDLEHITTDVRSFSFLERTAAGDYRFAHKSFMEYFVAAKLFDDFDRNEVGAFARHGITYEVAFFLGDMIYSHSGARKSFLRCVSEVLGPYSGQHDERLVGNILRTLGCSRLECERLTATGTHWHDIRATRIALSGHLKEQQWTRVVVADSSLRDIFIEGLSVVASRVSGGSFTNVSLQNVTSADRSTNSLQVAGVTWSKGELSGTCHLSATRGEWSDLVIDLSGGEVSLTDLNLRNCGLNVYEGMVRLRQCRLEEVTVKGVRRAVSETKSVAKALVQGLGRASGSAVALETASFRRCLFMFVDLDTLPWHEGHFEECFFIGCSFLSERWSSSRNRSALKNGNKFALLSVNRPQRERLRSHSASQDLCVTSEWLTDLEREGRIPTRTAAPITARWDGWSDNPLKAAQSDGRPPLATVDAGMTVEQILYPLRTHRR